MGKKKQQRTQQRQAQQKQQQEEVHFLTLVNQGVVLENSGDPQAACEKFRQAVQAAPSVWTLHRYFAFKEFLTLKTKPESRTQNDVEYVKRFIDNENEPAHFRAHAAFWAAVPSMQGKDMNVCRAAEAVREGLDIIAAAPEEDENRIVLSGGHFREAFGHSHDVTVKEMLGRIAIQMQTLLSMTEGEGVVVKNPEHALLVQRSYAGGNICDCCGKTLEELQLENFMLCKRCEMVYYCSETCQKEHWKHKGHKKACREPGQIEVGDDMVHRNDQDEPVTYVKVIECVEATTNRWKVQRHDMCDLFITVNGDNLHRIRPPPTCG